MREIPSINEIRDQISNDFKIKLNLTDSQLKYVLDAFDSVLAAQFKLMYLYLSDIQNNVFPDTADLEENGGTLERFGRIYLNRDPLPATAGIFKASVIGSNGAVLRNSLTFKSNENSLNPSQSYVLDDEYILTGSGDKIEIRSLGGGSDFDLNVGDELTITEPVLGVNNIVTVTEVIEKPRASEDIDVYRQNIIDSIQLEPQGGSKTDYREWAADAQGVRKVYPYVRNDDAGIVDVYIEATIADSVDGNGTPDSTLLSDVYGVIEFDPDQTKPTNERGRKPIQSNIETLAITITPVDITINGLIDDSTAVRDAIKTNIKDYLYNIRPYIAGADLPRDKKDILYSARVQSVITDVLESANYFENLTMEVNGNTVNNYEFNLGFIPYLRNLIFA
ncbi:putative baseplate protein [Flavobacterium phage V186]|nr:putative baseplate protein [Flavobacterium phage V186]QNJ53888.1 putative baseplate protein [Flavobacterium phage FCOV-F56]QNJ54114.1 putative baseplate protein [Flavobacterium phage V186]